MAEQTEFVCYICNAVFDDEQQLLTHFCPGAPAEEGA
jgi:hypothetical protein